MTREEQKTLLEELGKPFPKEAIKQRDGGGGRKFDYVEGHTVIRALNQYARVWDFQVLDTRLMMDDKLLVVTGRLTIPGLGSREHMGVQSIQSAARAEDLIKGGITDCLKKCATLFGVAQDLYGDDYLNPPYGKEAFERDVKAMGKDLSPKGVYAEIMDAHDPQRKLKGQDAWDLIERKMKEYGASGAGGKQDADTSDAG